MATNTTLHLVRHAEPAPHTEEADAPGLSSLGRAQALRVGERFASASLHAVLHSPQRRARETAQVLATRLSDSVVEQSQLLRDVTPVPGDQEDDSYPRWLRQRLLKVPAEERDVGGEGLSRTVRHFGQVYEREARHLLLITHAFVVGWFVRHALDAPAWRWAGLQPSNASVTIAQFSAARPPMLLAFNDVAHLQDL